MVTIISTPKKVNERKKSVTVKPYIYNLKEAEAMAKAEFEARRTIRDKLKVKI